MNFSHMLLLLFSLLLCLGRTISLNFFINSEREINRQLNLGQSDNLYLDDGMAPLNSKEDFLNKNLERATLLKTITAFGSGAVFHRIDHNWEDVKDVALCTGKVNNECVWEILFLVGTDAKIQVNVKYEVDSGGPLTTYPTLSPTEAPSEESIDTIPPGSEQPTSSTNGPTKVTPTKEPNPTSEPTQAQNLVDIVFPVAGGLLGGLVVGFGFWTWFLRKRPPKIKYADIKITEAPSQSLNKYYTEPDDDENQQTKYNWGDGRDSVQPKRGISVLSNPPDIAI